MTPILYLFILVISASEKIDYRNYKLYKITPKDENSVYMLREMELGSSDRTPYDFWNGVVDVDSPVNILVSPAYQDEFEFCLKFMNIDKEVVVNDIQEIFDDEQPLSDEPNPVNWTLYNTLDEINNWLGSLQEEFSDTVTLLQPGKTHEGRDIVGVKVDFSPNTKKSAIFVESNIHAREWITSAVSTYILDELLRSTDDRVVWAAKTFTWYFFPIMNPDGFVYSHTDDRKWRKTRTRYNIFCWGADPNRNWEFEWMLKGASSNPCSDIYAGPNPLSEPSVRVMRDFINTIGKDLTAYFSFHSYGQLLMLPYGHTPEHLENYDEMREIGEIAIENMRNISGKIYSIGNVAELLGESSGRSMDWVKEKFETPIVYSWEMRDTGNYGFALPADQIIPTGEETLESILTILEEYSSRHSYF
ncbi:hypothetical protein GWI33_016040 [Rhynchophorus ferrugineus]|uniref:Peptidase M14 domain-containing protein n=1 Tax=Rhynchophorus ferrugineus TaxID=354439 RepID=A0A834M947_RHYFE|nr:hypothetical protein GWI33_016040 [Rhynchophorus ferrugineus]